jgi:hypothetical protein
MSGMRAVARMSGFERATFSAMVCVVLPPWELVAILVFLIVLFNPSHATNVFLTRPDPSSAESGFPFDPSIDFVGIADISNQEPIGVYPVPVEFLLGVANVFLAGLQCVSSLVGIAELNLAAHLVPTVFAINENTIHLSNIGGTFSFIENDEAARVHVISSNSFERNVERADADLGAVCSKEFMSTKFDLIINEPRLAP